VSEKKFYVCLWEVDCEKGLDVIVPGSAIVIQQSDIHNYAVPRLIELYLEKKNALTLF